MDLFGIKKRKMEKEEAQRAEQAERRFNLGVGYFEGGFLAQSYELAVDSFIKAVNLGSGDAGNYLGYCYREGLGVEVDYQKAKEYFEFAVEKGITNGLYNLGMLYYSGMGVEEDIRIAIKHWEKGAEAGNSVCYNGLGHIYEDGNGVYIDEERAVEYYKKSAEMGDAHGMTCLAFCYMCGRGVEEDKTKAFKLFEESANKGDPQGQAYLGRAYGKGEGVEVDIEKAKEWLNTAYQNGYEEAATFYHDIEEDEEFEDLQTEVKELIFEISAIFSEYTKMLRIEFEKMDLDITPFEKFDEVLCELKNGSFEDTSVLKKLYAEGVAMHDFAESVKDKFGEDENFIRPLEELGGYLEAFSGTMEKAEEAEGNEI